MDSQEKFWVSVWAILASVVMAIVVATYLYNVQRDEKVTRMVQSGADPIYAVCSLGGLTERACDLYAAQDRSR